MKRSAFVCAVTLTLISSPLLAQHGHGGGKPTVTHASPSPKPTAPHGSPAPKPATSHGHASSAHATTHTTVHASSHSTAHGSTAHGSSSHTLKSTSPTHTATLTPVQQKLHQNTNLARKLRSRLPAGTNLDAAAAGFRNLGQFVAAVNVSNNLGIPFSELKTRMVDQGMSLGQAIQDVKRTAGTTAAKESR